MRSHWQCPFCSHRRHDGSQCNPCRPHECVGPTEAERAAFEAPEKILTWLFEMIVVDTLGDSTVGATEVTSGDDYIDVQTKVGKFRVKIEPAP